MKGHKFLKVTGILMIIGAVFSILGGVIFGGLGALVAGLGGASGLTFSYWMALLLTLGGGICEMIAGVKGVMNLVGGEEFSLLNVLTGVAIPALYIYGAVLNSKADDTQPTA